MRSHSALILYCRYLYDDIYMSKSGWNIWTILGILTILTAVVSLAGVPEQLAVLPPDQHPKLIAGVAIFTCLLIAIALACLVPRSRPFTLRILGAIGLAGSIFILVDGFQQRNFAQVPITLLFWLPGSIYLVLKGKMNSESSE